MPRTFRLAMLGLAIVLLFVIRASADDAKATEPFNGKDLSGWKFKGDAANSQWTVGLAKMNDKKDNEFVIDPAGHELINNIAAGKHGVDAYSEQTFGDATIEVEVMVPKGSNSGIYVMGEYEIQVFDSYGKQEIGAGDMGAIYSAGIARVNASKPAGEWQKYEITYRAPRFEGDKKTENARITKVVLNDQMLHEDVELKGPTPGGITGREAAKGPVMFQGDHGAVAYRNLKVMAK